MRREELLALCEAQIDKALGQYGGDLTTARAKAMDYYLGEMDEHLPSEEGRSGYVSRDVSDTVEWVLPSLMKIFMDAENAVSFEAQGPEDEPYARLETDAIRHILWERNDGFLTLYSMFKDALIAKTGIVKFWYEDGAVEREEYEGLTIDEYQKLLNDPDISVEVIEEVLVEPDAPGVPPTVNAVLAVQREPGEIRIAPVPPEEFGTSIEQRTPDIRETPFAFHRTRKSASDLIESGFDRKLVESLPFDGDMADSEERLARYHLSDEQEEYEAANKSMQTIWVAECYIRVDADDDGIAELLKVTLAGESPGSKILDVEEVDSIPFAVASPVVLPHKAVGLSLADLVMDIQDIRSSLLRGILDNTYLANNVRMAANENVNLDDLLISRSGGVIRTEGESPPGQNLMPVQHPPVPGETFGLLEVLDGIVKKRTGVSDQTMGLDQDALANVNTGVMVQAYESARMRIELMARLLAECGVKALFRGVHELMCKHVDRPLMMKLNQQWTRIDPREWRSRTNLKVNVGLGHHDRERRLMAANDMLQTQAMLKQAGGIVTPQHQYFAAAEKARAHGLAPEMYFPDPQTLPPPPPPPPDPSMLQAQASMARVEVDKARLQVDQQTSELDAQVKTLVAQSKEREAAMRAEMEQVKAEVMLRKQQVDEQSQVLNAMTNREAQKDNAAIQQQKLDWEKVTDRVDSRLEQYKAELQALTQFRTAAIQAQSKRDEEVRRLREQVQQMRVSLNERHRDNAAADAGAKPSGGASAGRTGSAPDGSDGGNP